MKVFVLLFFVFVFFVIFIFVVDDDFMSCVIFGYVDSNGVKIYYVMMGEGLFVVMIYGFLDFWYSWCDQMEILVLDF